MKSLFHFATYVAIALIIASCSCNTNHKFPAEELTNADDSIVHLCDSNASSATIALMSRLKSLKGSSYLIGHEDDLAYGHSWNHEEGRSDVKDVTGHYPALFGWEMGNIEFQSDTQLDGVAFEDIRKWVQQVHKMGGVNTMTWHSSNIITGNNCWDNTQNDVVEAVIPDGVRYDLYRKWMDKLASFISSLRDENGDLIPIIFRPYHEMTGSWFWWGRDLCSPEQYKTMWRMTFDYLTKDKGLHNLLFAYSTGDFNTIDEYLERYPGDDVVDILGFDIYQYGDDVIAAQKLFLDRLRSQSDIVSLYAKEHGKIWAVCETGLESVGVDDWFTKFGAVLDGTDAVYVMFWRNAHDKPNHFYVPYEGHSASADFKAFAEGKNAVMLD
ncbi:MAG: hypothetical protein HUJ96_06915 [Marinilabiliaceae bacterium]|nr:hypothetical protein [Marinilabiliaceae bacterium]